MNNRHFFSSFSFFFKKSFVIFDVVGERESEGDGNN